MHGIVSTDDLTYINFAEFMKFEKIYISLLSKFKEKLFSKNNQIIINNLHYA